MEFGSDFHTVNYPKGDSFSRYFSKANLYASGRNALLALAVARNWCRLWIPSYYCDESLGCLKRAKIQLKVYLCSPYSNIESIIPKIPANKGDGILVVNYFGIHSKRTIITDAEIVEDHTHNLIGEWSRNSSADWCIASLRKTIPIPDGGILWSPKGLVLPVKKEVTTAWRKLMCVRVEAMLEKTAFITGEKVDKMEYLRKFRETEDGFDANKLSGISDYSASVLSNFDIETWYSLKEQNFKILKHLINLPESVTLLCPEAETGTPFSYCLIFPDHLSREIIRQQLISHSIYPAILWNIPTDVDIKAKNIGDRILSIHCDGRYSSDDMIILAKTINDILRTTCV